MVDPSSDRLSSRGGANWLSPDDANLVLIGKDRARPVSLGTLIQLRWIALIGQLINLMIVYFRAGLNWPLALAVLALGALAISNLLLVRRRQKGEAKWLSTPETTRILSFDVVQAGLVLWFTGGDMNPFVILILVPVIISATTLDRVSTAILSLMAVVVVTLITIWSPSLSWRSGLLSFPTTYLVSVWASLVVAVVFVALFMQWVVEQARSLSDDLLTSQLALERERQVSAVGGLAAAAAHELGTPLATITLIATEMERDLPEDDELRDDLTALIEETDRCKDILKRLQKAPYRDPGEPYRLVPASALVELAAQPYLREAITFNLVIDGGLNHLAEGVSATGQEQDNGFVDRDIDQPTLPRMPELTYGLGNLLQNAFQFAKTVVTVRVGWTQSQIDLHIMDDGPGFDADMILQFQEGPIVPTADDAALKQPDRREGYSGLGLGVYIAKTLLNRSGAELEMLNRTDQQGAHVIVSWPRES